jgi:hypothetical protein
MSATTPTRSTRTAVACSRAAAATSSSGSATASGTRWNSSVRPSRYASPARASGARASARGGGRRTAACTAHSAAPATRMSGSQSSSSLFGSAPTPDGSSGNGRRWRSWMPRKPRVWSTVSPGAATRNGSQPASAVPAATGSARGAPSSATPSAAAAPISRRNTAARPARTPASTRRRGAASSAPRPSASAAGFGPGPVGNAIAPATATPARRARRSEPVSRRASR